MPNDLLNQLLLGGNRPDPTAEFIAQAFLSGRTPGDQGAAFQNVLTNLAPSVIAERRRLGPGIGEGLGLETGQADQALQQLLGLRLSPSELQEQRMGALEMMTKFLPEMQGLGLREEELEVRRGELDVKKEQAETAKGELGRKKKEGEVRGAMQEAITANIISMANARDATQRMRELARQIAQTGQMPDGSPVMGEEARVIYSLAGVANDQEASRNVRMAQFLLGTGNPDYRVLAATILSQETGYDTSAIADPPAWWERVLGFALPGPAPGAMPAVEGIEGVGEPGATSGLTEEEMGQVSQFGSEISQQMIEILKELDAQER
jgi:hypothetical protein